MMRNTLRRGFVALTLLLALGGCATEIIVRHQDPAGPAARIWVDGKEHGTVTYSNSLSVGVEPGRHTVKATPVGKGAVSWKDGAGAWTVVVERKAILTLLPRAQGGR